MTENLPRPLRTLWVGFVIMFGCIGLAFALWLVDFNRSYYQPLPVIGPVADFTLTNQDGKITTLAELTNHVWVADIIFTRCAGPCPRLTRQMHGLQILLPESIKLVTLTTDPDFDSPAVLKKYGERAGADFNCWTFLTGTKREIALLASGSLKLSSQPVTLDQQQNPVDLFIHATLFVVVDKHARLRTYFETGGDGVDWTNVQPKILAAVRRLENEP